MEKQIIQVFNIVGSPYCVEAEDGEKLFQILRNALSARQPIEISFLNVEILTTAFLNTAVGQLYRDFSNSDIKKYLTVTSLSATGAVALRRVVETAKLYYKDPEAMERSINEILGE
ncbi:MAG: STAS-like domain-containing protein [Bacteroidia bacterium]|nr:STAS-like domain-containing protein [Bacteroidia bacterium]